MGSSLGAVELAVALHYTYNTPTDKIVWDVGHQAYAHKIITGRREQFRTNRTYGGISGFPKMSESIFDSFGVGHSSTSVSAALGMATAARLSGSGEKIVAVIGDGAMTGGLAFEGLNNAGAMKTDILVILNDNHISIDHGRGGLHDYLLKISTSETYNRIKNHVWDTIGSTRLRRWVQKVMFSTKMAIFRSGSLFESFGFRYFGAIDGHDIGQLTTTLASLRNIKGTSRVPSSCTSSPERARATVPPRRTRPYGTPRAPSTPSPASAASPRNPPPPATRTYSERPSSSSPGPMRRSSPSPPPWPPAAA